ncbi:hypothetical protein MMC28_008917 [Mycoblastus sanguinarius]|nr:hypothetical protein [Mycoblastus sanguinarius]
MFLLVTSSYLLILHLAFSVLARPSNARPRILPLINLAERVSGQQRRASLSTETQNLAGIDSLNVSNGTLPLLNLSDSTNAPPSYPVTCFNHRSTQLKPASVENCQFIINQVILRYPNPMLPQTFGYTASADIDLSLPENEKWIWGNCVIYISSLDKTNVDTFRMVDVAYTAHRITTQCVVETKYPVGGTADLGYVFAV